MEVVPRGGTRQRMTPHKCPACDGWGTREIWYWLGSTSTFPNILVCRACNGTGIIWEGALQVKEDCPAPGVDERR